MATSCFVITRMYHIKNGYDLMRPKPHIITEVKLNKKYKKRLQYNLKQTLLQLSQNRYICYTTKAEISVIHRN